MKNWIKRLLMLMLLLTAILMLAAPGALADSKDMSDFDESDWEDYWGGFFAICSECDKWEADATCMVCILPSTRTAIPLSMQRSMVRAQRSPWMIP